MKIKVSKKILLTVVALLALMLQGCGSKESFGEAVVEKSSTPIADVLSKPADYRGKTVKIEGEIVSECPSGCWFEVGEGNAVAYVDIAPQGLAIPQRVGKKVVVEGTVSFENQKVVVLGKGVEIQ